MDDSGPVTWTDSQGEAPRLVTAPRDGDVSVIADWRQLREFIASIDRQGPIAVDAERAQSFRYSAKAYLIQFRQDGCGTKLVDPIALAGTADIADLSELDAALASCEWVLHAASQDLPCLAQLGLRPKRLFDTELAGRLLGLDKVSLSPMLTRYLGIELAKAHSADDWSTRPLPASWLAYAALDVDYLLALRDAVSIDLAAAGKSDWAQQEFEMTITHFAVPPSDDPERWRHTKGLGHLRQPLQLAVARNLWLVRDELARKLDIFPGRILPDTSLVDAALVFSRLTPQEVVDVINTQPGFTGPLARRQRTAWSGAVTDALTLAPGDMPQREPRHPIPPHRVWAQLNEAANRRWEAARPAVLSLAEEHNLPAENLMTVSTLAELIWSDSFDGSDAGLRAAMTRAGARPWQQDLLAAPLAQALLDI